MRAVVITKHGGPDVLKVQERPDPPLGRGEVRIDVGASGVNFADVMAVQGMYPDAPKPPCVIGYEVAGTIDAVGDGVTAHRAGDRVMAMTRFGGQSELVVVNHTAVLPLPDGWSFEEGASFPVVYVTAHHMLVRVAAAHPGESVLVHAAAGGVGLAVAELGRILGLRVIGIASPGKHEILRSYGVAPIDGRDPKWWDAVRAIAPKGVDIVLDPVGGDAWRHGYRLLAPLGRLICFGVSDLSTGLRRNPVQVIWKALRWPRFGPISLMDKNRIVAGVNIGHIWDNAAVLAPQLGALLGYARAGKLRPRVDRSFPVEEAAAAHQFIHERRNVGKVVLTFG